MVSFGVGRQNLGGGGRTLARNFMSATHCLRSGPAMKFSRNWARRVRVSGWEKIILMTSGSKKLARRRLFFPSSRRGTSSSSVEPSASYTVYLPMVPGCGLRYIPRAESLRISRCGFSGLSRSWRSRGFSRRERLESVGHGPSSPRLEGPAFRFVDWPAWRHIARPPSACIVGPASGRAGVDLWRRRSRRAKLPQRVDRESRVRTLVGAIFGVNKPKGAARQQTLRKGEISWNGILYAKRERES